MAVKIRLARYGGKKKAFYRIVAADSRSPRNGKFLTLLGIYDPSKNPARVEVKVEKAIEWLKKGALPTDTVRELFKKAGVKIKGDVAV